MAISGVSMGNSFAPTKPPMDLSKIPGSDGGIVEQPKINMGPYSDGGINGNSPEAKAKAQENAKQTKNALLELAKKIGIIKDKQPTDLPATEVKPSYNA